MDAVIINEKQLITEIDKLRQQFPNTQDLYREVCVLLFFRYGMAPTANKLYQLVRKGSMSAPAEALNKFWGDLRDKSRVRIEHPDLPESIKNTAGELVASLWTSAQEAAAASLDSFRSEAQAQATEAKAAMEAAQIELAKMQEQLHQSQQGTSSAKQEIGQLQQQLAAERATREAIEQQLSKAQEDIAAHLAAQESARRYFAEEMEKLRSASQLDKERFAAAERRFLQEVDRERQTAARLQKELDQAKQESQRLLEQARSELNGLQNQIGDLRQQLGMMEGQLQTTVFERNQAAENLKQAQLQYTESFAKQAQLAQDLEMWRQRAEKAENSLAEHTAKAGSKPNRKTKVSAAS